MELEDGLQRSDFVPEYQKRSIEPWNIVHLRMYFVEITQFARMMSTLYTEGIQLRELFTESWAIFR